MAALAVPAAAPVLLPVLGRSEHFPVRRVYCVGRNFAEHAKEMGASVDRGTPVIFLKPGDAVVPEGGAIAYPSGTRDLHHEVELVVALGRDVDAEITAGNAAQFVYAYGVGLDLTRRDLQAAAKAKSLPWDTGKSFEQCAPVSALRLASEITDLGGHRLWLDVNGERRQQGRLDEMVFSVADILRHLAGLYTLRAGDLIFMGTPAGVAALQPGDRFHAGIDGIAEMQGHIVAASV